MKCKTVYEQYSYYCFFTPLEESGKKLFSAIVVFFISSSSEILRTQGFIEINFSIKKVLQNFLSVNEIQIFKYFQKIL